MASTTTFKLNTGASIPAIGFGTWQDKDAQEEAVLTALKAGYRHIDTAHVYGTEEAVGKAIKKSGLDRSEIFITTKLWNNHHHPEDVEPALEKSLKALNLDYVDLYLMHWPSPFARSEKLFPKDSEGKTQAGDTHFVDTWKALEKVVKTGKTKAIGISNFSKAELEKLLAETDVVPAAHQIERHPWLAQNGFIEFHKKHNIHVTHYSPLGNQNEIYDKGKALPKLMEEEVLVNIGKKYNKSGAQTALAWGIAHGCSVIPKSKTEARIKQNLEADFKLAEGEVKQIDEIDRVAAHPDARGFRGKQIEMYDELKIVCGNYQAPSRWAKMKDGSHPTDLKNCDYDSASYLSPSTEYLSETDGTESYTGTPEYAQMPDGTQDPPLGQPFRQLPKRSRGSEVLDDAMLAVASSIRRLADVMERGKCSIDAHELLQAVMEIDGLEEAKQMYAFEYLNADPIKARAFLTYTARMRKIYLFRQFWWWK